MWGGGGQLREGRELGGGEGRCWGRRVRMALLTLKKNMKSTNDINTDTKSFEQYKFIFQLSNLISRNLREMKTYVFTHIYLNIHKIESHS